jgi:osmotically-inducible protein OsmY
MTQTLHKTDHELKIAIDAELEWAPNVKADRVGIAVRDGAVTLSGQVETYPEKEAAVRAALRVRGVTAVADEIVVEQVWGPRDDTDIAREAGAALDRSVVVPQHAVKARVHNHVVTLTGTVPWRYQREAARHAVAGLPGVSDVVDQIVLAPPVTISAAKAKSKITSALVRNAQLDANRITVGIHGSEVTLSGTVSSWAERRQAEHAAWSAPGVTSVRNQITVTS